MFIKHSLCVQDCVRNQEYCDEQKSTLRNSEIIKLFVFHLKMKKVNQKGKAW